MASSDRRDTWRLVLVGAVSALIAAALVWLLLGRRSQDAAVPVGADIPTSDQVSSWSEAAAVAGVELFAPDAPILGTPSITVRGVRGDPTRPVLVAYPEGVQIVEAQRDVLPAPASEADTLSITGADEAWRGEVEGTRYLYVRRGATLVSLSGATERELMSIAAALQPVPR